MRIPKRKWFYNGQHEVDRAIRLQKITMGMNRSKGSEPYRCLVALTDALSNKRMWKDNTVVWLRRCFQIAVIKQRLPVMQRNSTAGAVPLAVRNMRFSANTDAMKLTVSLEA